MPNPGWTHAAYTRRSAIEFGCRPTVPAKSCCTSLERHFIALAQQDQHPVVLIDEAQALPADTLEAVRLLTNLETEKRKLLQVVLFGQPELMTRLHEKAPDKFSRESVSMQRYGRSIVLKSQLMCSIASR